tara:strand:- start:58107 stop:59543 length:1437 start_codon:yes stop_codon:yes gene_type:complete
MTNSQPLSQEYETYAISPAWQQQAELLAHLSQFSQNVLCVVGPPASGKTQFLQYFIDQEHPGLRKHVIFQPPTTVDALMKVLADSFELPWTDKGSNVKNEVDALSETQENTWVLLVDNADTLSEECLFALLKLVRFDVEPRRQLHLILLGQPELEKTLYSRDCQEVIRGHCHTMELAAYGDAQIANNTNQNKRRSQLPLDADLLSQDAVVNDKTAKTIQTNSQGVTMSQGTMSKRSIQQYLFHPISFGAVAGIGLGIVYLMLNPLDEMEWQSPPTNAAQLAEVTFQSELMSQPNPKTEKLKVKIAASGIPEEELVNEQTTTSEEIPLANLVPELGSTKMQDEQLEMAQAVQSVQKVSEAKKQSSHSATKTAASSSPYTSGEQYLLSTKSSRYTLQLMGGTSEAGVKQFMKKNQLEDKAYTYRKDVNGQPWYVVVLGDYQSRQEANQAAQQLPATVKQTVKPWVRKIGSIQSEIKAGQV